MKIAFEFNDGETAQQIVSAIVGLFGATTGGVTISAPALTIAGASVPATLNPADNDDADGPSGTPADPAKLDAEGIPHDARIHSKVPQLTDKNVWRKRRAVAATTVAAVTAELRAKVGSVAQSPVAAPLTAPGTLAPPAAAPLQAPAPLAPLAAQVGPYEKFVKFIADNTAPAGRLTPEYIGQSLASYGYKDTTGAGSLMVVQHAPEANIVQLAQAFATALGVPSPL
jgi:hypothetical protein